MHAIIHIGTAKTGTTSIQRFFSDNRALLQEQGYLYPRSLSAGDPTAHNYAHNQLARKLLGAQGGDMLAPLQAEIAACGANKGIIISAEMLSHFMDTPAQVCSLQDFLQPLDCDDITIAVWLREQGAMFSSLCSQDLRNGEMAWAHVLPPRNNVRFRFSMDYRELLQRWMAVFGRQAMQVRLFEREGFVQGDLQHDAVDAFGLEWDERFTHPPPPQ